MLFVLQSEHGCRDTVSKQNVRTVLGRVPLLTHKACCLTDMPRSGKADQLPAGAVVVRGKVGDP